MSKKVKFQSRAAIIKSLSAPFADLEDGTLPSGTLAAFEKDEMEIGTQWIDQGFKGNKLNIKGATSVKNLSQYRVRTTEDEPTKAEESAKRTKSTQTAFDKMTKAEQKAFIKANKD